MNKSTIGVPEEFYHRSNVAKTPFSLLRPSPTRVYPTRNLGQKEKEQFGHDQIQKVWKAIHVNRQSVFLSVRPSLSLSLSPPLTFVFSMKKDGEKNTRQQGKSQIEELQKLEAISRWPHMFFREFHNCKYVSNCFILFCISICALQKHFKQLFYAIFILSAE